MIYTKRKTCLKDHEGAAAVEFALVLPLLMLFIFGIIEFGLLLFNQQVITNAVREGTRTGVLMRGAPRTVATEDLLIKNVVVNFAQSHLVTFGSDTFNTSDVIINNGVARVQADLVFQNNLTVKANFSYKFLFLSTIGIGPINLNPISTMRME